MKITKGILDEYRDMKKKNEIPLLEAELKNMLTTDAGIGNSTIFDYRTGHGRPQSVVGFDWDKYEHRKMTLDKKKAKAKTVEEWIESIEDGQSRCVFRMFYKEGMDWKTVAKNMGMPQNEDYARVCIRDAYLKRIGIE